MDQVIQRLLMALVQGSQEQPAGPSRPSGRLATALAGKRSGDAKYARLPALPKYGEAKHAGSHGGTNGTSSDAALGAFQNDAFQNDAFQVD